MAINVIIAALVADGVKYVFVAGTTGEGLSLSKDERKNLAAQWQTVGSAFKIGVLVHVGAESIADATELAAHGTSFIIDNK
jgi:N-acetylneuraminate lyase